MSEEKSQLPNWSGLLGWSTKFHDGTSASQLGPMDHERRQWLEQALDSAFGGQEDPNKMMKKAVEEIHEGRISSGLDMLDYGSDMLECAENVDKVGALVVLIDLIKSSSSDVVVRSLNILSLYLSNNPRVQIAAAIKYELMIKLRETLSISLEDRSVTHAILSAFGALVRNVEVLENSFIRDKYIDALVSLAVETDDIVIVQKVVSLVASLGERHGQEVLPFARALIERVHSVKGEFDPSSIQFWEIASRLLFIEGVGREYSHLVKSRIDVIGKFENHDEFAAEKDALKSFL